jgi:hypothetical protein
MLDIDPLKIDYEPLAGSTFINILRMLAQNHFKIGLIGIPRLLYSLSLSFALSPLNILERTKYDKVINSTKIDKPPIFIIGHFRSGTTYLHNLLTQDEQFAYPTTFQTITPALFLRFEKIVKPIVISSLPEKRPQDDIKVDADYPQEEEYAIGNLSPFSYYNGWCFPKNMQFYFNYVHMQDVSEKTIDDWKKIYVYFLKKVTYSFNGKQLVLKNPPNTSRIKLLLEMFPDAKFIHIYRNPYHVYLSMRRMLMKEMTLQCIQKPKDIEEIERIMVEFYKTMYDKFFIEKVLIPKGNFAEVRYEEFLKNPYEQIKKLYQELNLPGFEKSNDNFKKYINSQSKVKTHSYKIEDEIKNKIYSAFSHYIDLWDYSI